MAGADGVTPGVPDIQLFGRDGVILIRHVVGIEGHLLTIIAAPVEKGAQGIIGTGIQLTAAVITALV